MGGALAEGREGRADLQSCVRPGIVVVQPDRYHQWLAEVIMKSRGDLHVNKHYAE